jgi:conjugal transfer/entry exclusion protein
VSADADRIGQLTAEVDERHAKLVEVADKLRAERAAHERTKAELAEVKASYDGAHAASLDWAKEAGRIVDERDAAQAKLASVEADAAIIDGAWSALAATNDLLVEQNKALTAALEVLAARVPLLKAVATAAHRYWHGLSGDIGSHDQMERALRALATFDEEMP